MFKDTERELKRLEEELLAEEEETKQQPEEDEDDLDFFLENFDFGEEEPETPQVPVHAYNTDTTDTDLEEYSEETWEATPKKDRMILSLTVLAVLLTVCIVAVLIWAVGRYGLLGG